MGQPAACRLLRRILRLLEVLDWAYRSRKRNLGGGLHGRRWLWVSRFGECAGSAGSLTDGRAITTIGCRDVERGSKRGQMRVTPAVVQVATLASGVAMMIALGACDSGRALSAPSVPVPPAPGSAAVRSVLLSPATDVVVAGTSVGGTVVLNTTAPAAGATV